MYRCNLCGKTVPPGVPCKKVVTQTRVKDYPARRNCNRPIFEMENGRLKKRPKSCDDPGGRGIEAATEASSCPTCAREWECRQAERHGTWVKVDIPENRQSYPRVLSA